jgi:hypothetical protein
MLQLESQGPLPLILACTQVLHGVWKICYLSYDIITLSASQTVKSVSIGFS